LLRVCPDHLHNIMSSRDPLVYILVLNWNGWEDTIACLESVLSTDYSNYRIIVCDNGSSDQSLHFIKTWADSGVAASQSEKGAIPFQLGLEITKPVNYVEYSREVAEQGGKREDCSARLVLIRNGSNLGFAGGNNVGLRYALSRGDFGYVWILNNDTVVKRDALVHLVRRMQGGQDLGICGSTVLYYHDPAKVQAYGGATFNKATGTTQLIGHLSDANAAVDAGLVEDKLDCVLGASMLVSDSFLSKIGLISEDYFLYYEEIDWALRAKIFYRLAYAAGSVVYHKEGGSVGSGSWSNNQSRTLSFYNSRNRLKVMRKFYPNALPMVYLSLVCSILGRIYRGQWRNALIIFLNLTGMEKLNKKIAGI